MEVACPLATSSGSIRPWHNACLLKVIDPYDPILLQLGGEGVVPIASTTHVFLPPTSIIFMSLINVYCSTIPVKEKLFVEDDLAPVYVKPQNNGRAHVRIRCKTKCGAQNTEFLWVSTSSYYSSWLLYLDVEDIHCALDKMSVLLTRWVSASLKSRTLWRWRMSVSRRWRLSVSG